MSFKKVRRVVLKWFGAGIVKNEGATSNLLEQVSQCLHFDGSVFAGFYESGWPDRLVSGTGEFVLRWAIQPCPTTLCNTSGKGDENFALSGRDDAIVKGVGRSTKNIDKSGRNGRRGWNRISAWSTRGGLSRDINHERLGASEAVTDFCCRNRKWLVQGVPEGRIVKTLVPEDAETPGLSNRAHVRMLVVVGAEI